MKEQKNIEDYPFAITINQTKIIIKQMEKSICKIKGEKSYGTGFFCKIPFKNENLPLLITNYHVINNKYLNENKRIELLLNDNKQIKIINIDDKRIIYTNEKYDVMAIQIKDKDNIKNFLELDDMLISNNWDFNTIKKSSIYILQYAIKEKVIVSYGTIKEINNENIMHLCYTEKGTSGSPILNLSTNKVIGIHQNYSKNLNINRGIYFKYFLNSFYNDLNDFLINNNSYHPEILANYICQKTPFSNFFIGHNFLKNKDNNYNSYNTKTQNEKKIKNKYHFMCHNCKQFPLINFQSSTSVNILCGCNDLKNKELEYLFKNYIVLENKDFQLIQCILHKKRFNYYCSTCFSDICKDCLDKERIHSKHDLKFFDIIKFDINIKIEKLIDKYNITEEIFDNDFNINDDIYTIDKIIKILIYDFKSSPCNNLFKTINNFYNFIFAEGIEITNEKDLDNINQTEIINSIIIKNQEFNIYKLKNFNLNNLNILSLRDNNINDLSSFQNSKLEELKFLDLSNNNIDDNGITILEKLNLNSLTFLNLSSNKITNFNSFKIFTHLEKLKEFYIGNNNFDENTINNVDDNVKFSNLQEIDLSNGIFSNFSIQKINKFNFIKLKKLYLNRNNLDALNFIKDLNCQNLEEIYLNNNKIKKYKSFNNLKNLNYIEIRNNQITEIEDIIKIINDLSNLKKINLKGNYIDFKNKEKLNILKEIISKRNIKLIA